jgi:hypothetical protein
MTSSILLLLLAAQADVPLPDVRLSDAAVLRFVEHAEGKRIVTADDDFTASLSRFDLQCRLKTDKEVTLADWKSFVASHVRPWQAEDATKIGDAAARVRARLEKYRIPLPAVIRLVRTTGEEESEAAYTRGDAIILPDKVLKYPPTQLDRLLLHELFHIISRHDGALRARLYQIVGFEVCEPIDLPKSLAPRKITNPDAPLIDCVITLAAADGKTHTGAPVLYSARDYDPKKSGTIFQSLVFRLLLVEKRSGRWQPLLKSGEPIVINVRDEAAYLDKIGKNTNYVIHPDEILADNFVRLLMDDADIPTPRITDAMRRTLGGG